MDRRSRRPANQPPHASKGLPARMRASDSRARSVTLDGHEQLLSNSHPSPRKTRTTSSIRGAHRCTADRRSPPIRPTMRSPSRATTSRSCRHVRGKGLWRRSKQRCSSRLSGGTNIGSPACRQTADRQTAGVASASRRNGSVTLFVMVVNAGTWRLPDTAATTTRQVRIHRYQLRVDEPLRPASPDGERRQ